MAAISPPRPESREAKTEQYLKRGGYKWVHIKIKIAEIDVKASEENPARTYRKTDTLRATEYGCAMLDGVIFPAIVVLNHEDPHDGMIYIVATGMHRLFGAIEAKFTEIDAYVVTEADHYRRDALTRMINAIEGQGMTLHEQIVQVLILKETYPSKTLTELAKNNNVKFHTLKTAFDEQKSRDRARPYNVDFDKLKLPQKSIVALGTIKNEPAFKSSIFVCNDVGNGITSPEIREMVSEVNKSRDERSQLAVVARYRAAAENKLARAATKIHRIRPAKVNQLVYDVRRVQKHSLVPLDELHVDALEQRVEVKTLLIDHIEFIKRVVGEIERVERMSRPGAAGAAD